MVLKAVAEACIGLGEELAGQAELFEPGAMPFDLEVCKGAKRLAATGRITTRNDARAVAIAACKLAGLSDAETARRVGCSRNTIAPVIEQLESSGRIPSLQTRLQTKLGRLAESAADELLDLVGQDGGWNQDRSGAVRALGVALGITVEKHLLVTGQATQIVEQRVVAPTADAVREWEDKLRSLFGPVLDVEALPGNPSDVQPVDPTLPTNTLADPATPLATPPTPADLPQAPLDLTPHPPRTGGGGSLIRPAPERSEELP